jgi:hypothetical protein
LSLRPQGPIVIEDFSFGTGVPRIEGVASIKTGKELVR